MSRSLSPPGQASPWPLGKRLSEPSSPLIFHTTQGITRDEASLSQIRVEDALISQGSVVSWLTDVANGIILVT